MDSLLIFAAGEPAWAPWTITLLKVILGLGFVIFVHELGHFLVAKLCGVKCEKFYLGFDIFGLKLARYRWGETEYGIGILPLGGYVKMLGQEDNPARLREEVERAKAAQAAGAPAPTVEETGAPLDVAEAERALYDPRSYLAQSVPERMAIISAGVIMNVIFAFLMAIVAYQIGVREIAAAVGGVLPGDTAWQIGLDVGDRVVEIDGTEVRRFRDLQRAVSLGDVDDGVTMKVFRPGVDQPIEVVAKPRTDGLMPTIGVISPFTTTLSKVMAVYPASPAALARPQFIKGDRIVQIDEQEIDDYAQISRYLAAHPEKPITVAVERTTGGSTARVSMKLRPRPLSELGMVMEIGPIAAVRQGSPADRAGLREGDRLLEIDGQPLGDPMTLPARAARLARDEGEVTLTVQRAGESKPVTISTPLGPAETAWMIYAPGSPVAVPALGIACPVVNRVATVAPQSPAAAAGIRPGDVIEALKVIAPDRDSLSRDQLGIDPKELDWDSLTRAPTVKLGPDAAQWPHVFSQIQGLPPGFRLRLTLAGGKDVTLQPRPSDEWFDADRGLQFEPLEVTRQAESFRDAVRLAKDETIDALTMVFQTIHRLSTGQVSSKLLGGPVTIFRAASHEASQGTAKLLLFLTMLSANLAVLNFLPIPVLDGGHMVFLAYEGLRGRPPSEKVHLGLTYFGLALILLLMVWVLGLDFGLIARQ
ncbi:MAG: site-2 protease family protein [Thermoguttaceae bacterium]|nr:site-2 protease family protein [Thermoguttaceae bacterium]